VKLEMLDAAPAPSLNANFSSCYNKKFPDVLRFIQQGGKPGSNKTSLVHAPGRLFLVSSLLFYPFIPRVSRRKG